MRVFMAVPMTISEAVADFGGPEIVLQQEQTSDIIQFIAGVNDTGDNIFPRCR